MSLEFVKFTLAPWLTRWEQSLQQALLSTADNDIYIRHNLEGLLRGDFKSRMESYAIGIQNGFYSVNDVRRLEDMDLVSDEEGGNLHLVNGNMLPLPLAGSFYKKGGDNDA